MNYIAVYLYIVHSTNFLHEKFKEFNLFFFLALWPNEVHGLFFHEISRSHTTRHHRRQGSSGRVICSSPSSLLGNIQQSHQTDFHFPGGIRIHNPSKEAAPDPRLRQRGHWDLQLHSHVM